MRNLLLSMALLILSTAALAAGTLENHQITSDALGESAWVQVYLPEGYDPAGPRQYPLVVFLHGAIGDDHTSYRTTLIPALDTAIADGTIQPMIVVKPDGGGCGPWFFFTGCNWVNSETLGAYEDFIVQDVVTWAEANYNVMPGRESRAILGHSMGGFGAMHTALKHPGTFAAVASHSGYLYFDDLNALGRPLLIAEQTVSPPYTWTPWVGTLTAAWFMFASGFSPNPLNPPYESDFPLDANGAMIPAVFDRWLEHDPAGLAEALQEEVGPDIYFDCGTADDFGLHPYNVHFHDHLTSLGIVHDWRSYNGNHSNQLPQRFAISLQFLSNSLQNPTAVESIDTGNATVTRIWNQPNPVRSRTSIRFQLAEPGPASLKVYDVSGRLRDTLVDGSLTAGPHQVEWNTRRVPAGVYYYQLVTARQVENRRLVVLK